MGLLFLIKNYSEKHPKVEIEIEAEVEIEVEVEKEEIDLEDSLISLKDQG
jgi:hypothetical protein